MNDLIVHTNPEVERVFENFPDAVREKMLTLRELVLETAREMSEISNLEETLKWGEPSYISPIGSTLRMDWKAKKPDQYALYFKCTSRLVETFRAVYGDQLNFEGNRAIVFQLHEQIPKEILKQCIRATLRYHKVNHLSTLGI